MLKCDICSTDGHYKLRNQGRIWFCKDCFRSPPQENTTALHMKVNVGSLKNVSLARVKELDRRVVLPDTVPGKDYVVGRRNNDGSISDKACDIRP